MTSCGSTNRWTYQGCRAMLNALPPSSLRAIYALMGESPSDDILQSSAADFLVEDPARFHFDSKRRMFGSSTVALITTSPCRYATALRSPAKWLHVVIVLNGSILIRPVGGESQECRPGEAFATSELPSVTIEAPSHVRALTVFLSLERLRRFGLKITSNCMLFDAAAIGILPLRAFALALLDPSWKTHSQGASLSVMERVLEELVLGLFLDAEESSVDDADLRALLRGRAVDYIAAEHHSPHLTPAVVAAHLGVSLRHLQRAFEGEDATTAQLILNHRTASAALILRGLSTKHLTLDEVAARVGFSSTFELRAAFKSQLGTLPSTFRETESLRDIASPRLDDSAGRLIAARVSAGQPEPRPGPVIMAAPDLKEW